MGSEPSLIDYMNAFSEFDKEINKIHNNIPSQEVNYEGYLINYKNYQNFRSHVTNLYNNHQKKLISANNINQMGFNNYNENLEKNKLTTENLSEVESQILNGESFIIINKKLFKLICKKNEPENHKIEYTIIAGNPGFLKFKQNNNQKIVQYKNNKTNIIDKSTTLGIKDNEGANNNISNNEKTKDNTVNNDNWIIIYRHILNYFNFENYISNHLNNKMSQPLSIRGFLIDNDWVDNWKKKSFYNEFKSNIIEKDIKDDNLVRNFIITKQLETKSNYDGILDIKNYIISENQIEEILKTGKSYAVLNDNFVNQFISNSNIYLITFVLSYQNIDIKVNNIPFLSFQTNSNVIINRAINYSSSNSKPTQINPNNVPINNSSQSIKISNSNEINKLKKELSKANKIIEQQKITINELQNKLDSYNTILNNLNNNINNYKNIIVQKDAELNNLRAQFNNNNIKNIQNKVYFNDIMCVNFISSDQNVHFAASCLKTDTFAEIEEKLYKQYPQYRETNNSFLANGTQVLRFKTIAENKIGNGLPVTLIVPS